MSEINPSNDKNYGRIILTVVVAAFSIIFLGFIAIKGISLIQTSTGSFDERNAALQSIYSAFLPLVGTWMGAVIAYYFGKENFDAANKNVQAMVQKMITSEDKLKSIKVSDSNVMISIDNMTDNKSIRLKADNAILIEADLLGFFETNKNFDRLPVMDDKYLIRYILHKSLITDFAQNFHRKKITNPTLADKDFNKITLDDLINNSNEDYKQSALKSIEFVGKDASLLEAQNKMNNSKYCQDVFVTEDGTGNKPVIGWITNNRINELGKV